MNKIIDIAGIRSMWSLREYLKETFCLPDHYGRNIFRDLEKEDQEVSLEIESDPSSRETHPTTNQLVKNFQTISYRKVRSTK